MVSPNRFWRSAPRPKVADSKAVRATARFRRFSRSEAVAVVYIGGAGLVRTALGIDPIDAARLGADQRRGVHHLATRPVPFSADAGRCVRRRGRSSASSPCEDLAATTSKLPFRWSHTGDLRRRLLPWPTSRANRVLASFDGFSQMQKPELGDRRQTVRCLSIWPPSRRGDRTPVNDIDCATAPSTCAPGRTAIAPCCRLPCFAPMLG